MFLENAVAAGVSVADFWAMTPIETQIVIDAHIDRRERDWDEIRTQAWLVAALSRQKELPELGKFLNPPKPKTAAEIEEDRKYFSQMRERVMARQKEVIDE